MTKAKRYETVLLREPVAGFPAGQVGAVVEVYTSPYEAYDVEIVDDDGHTRGLLEAVRPEQIDVAGKAKPGRAVAATRAPNPLSAPRYR
jgi:hypothetical protein